MEWLPLVLYTLGAIVIALAIGRSTRECATKEAASEADRKD